MPPCQAMLLGHGVRTTRPFATPLTTMASPYVHCKPALHHRLMPITQRLATSIQGNASSASTASAAPHYEHSHTRQPVPPWLSKRQLAHTLLWSTICDTVGISSQPLGMAPAHPAFLYSSGRGRHHRGLTGPQRLPTSDRFQNCQLPDCAGHGRQHRGLTGPQCLPLGLWRPISGRGMRHPGCPHAPLGQSHNCADVQLTNWRYLQKAKTHTHIYTAT